MSIGSSKPHRSPRKVKRYLNRLPVSQQLELNHQVSLLLTPAVLALLGRSAANRSDLVCANILNQNSIVICCATPAIASALKHQYRQLKQALIEAASGASHLPSDLQVTICNLLQRRIEVAVSPAMQQLTNERSNPSAVKVSRPISTDSVSAIRSMGNQVKNDQLRAALERLSKTLSKSL